MQHLLHNYPFRHCSLLQSLSVHCFTLWCLTAIILLNGGKKITFHPQSLYDQILTYYCHGFLSEVLKFKTSLRHLGWKRLFCNLTSYFLWSSLSSRRSLLWRPRPHAQTLSSWLWRCQQVAGPGATCSGMTGRAQTLLKCKIIATLSSLPDR